MNVGMRLNGSTVMAVIEGPCGLSKLAVVPRLTAMTRSAIPRNCQRMKLLRCLGLARLHATKAAVAPMAMSPYPAGNANIAGRMPRASKRTKVNPTILQACADVKILGFMDRANCRNRADAANHSEKTIIGVRAAIATASPMRFESFLNRCRAEADKTKMNQPTMIPVVTFL